jgi:hypothetical protein
MVIVLAEDDLRRVAYWLRRLPREFVTPAGFPPEYRQFIRERRLAVFRQWPTGHWEVTEAGREFINQYGENDA